MAGDLKVTLDTSGIDRILAAEPQRVGRWLTGFAESIVTDIVLSLGTSPPGRSYTRGGVTHVASAPGFPPNVDIGNLKASIHQENTGPFERTIMDGTDYGDKLEEGTTKMAARPFFRPAFDAAQQRIERDAAANLNLE